MSEPTSIVDVRDLRVVYRSGRDEVMALQGVGLRVAPGEIVAVVGESGSGKSTLAHAVLGLLPSNAGIRGGTISVLDGDFVDARRIAQLGLAGRVVGLVPQDPAVGLNPTMRIGPQIAEAIAKARGIGRRGLDREVETLLEEVGIDRPSLRARQYPHQLSGGMKQRVLIAIALAADPALIIADEPTSALDVTVQRRILDLMERRIRDRGIALLIITHDLGVAADRADRILVMKDGSIVEEGSSETVLQRAGHDYTRALIAAAPTLAAGSLTPTRGGAPSGGVELLRLEAVGKAFDLPRHAEGGGRLQALDRVSFAVHAGETVAVVGESGSGKTTACRIALGLERATDGRIFVEGRDVTDFGWRDFRPLRRKIQLVHQNPFAALDPRFTVFESIVEPLVSYRLAAGRELDAAAARLLDDVRLPRGLLDRRPRELSGGQCQRVAIARALALRPDLIVLDEAVSALDVSVRGQILDLLRDLQDELNLAYVFVTHDLSVVASIAHRVVVMRAGRVVEQGDIADVFGAPMDAYTRQLLDAVPGSLARDRPNLQ